MKLNQAKQRWDTGTVPRAIAARRAHRSAACLRARYCTDLAWLDLAIQLIQLFLWVCTAYDKHPTLKYRRWSPNTTEPLFTDQELIVYLFGHLQRRFKQKMIHNYVQEHWGARFPQLPSYQVFNHRLNLQRFLVKYRLP